MQFSSILNLIDASFQHQVSNAPFKGASLFLFVNKKEPLELHDTNRVTLSAPVEDLQAFFQSYDKIAVGSNICMDNVEVHPKYAKGYELKEVVFTSKKVITDIGSAKEKELKNFEMKVRLSGDLNLAMSTYGYIRRIEKQELAKKHHKPSKADPLNFIPKKRNAASIPADSELSGLDSESVSHLRKLVRFVDKEDLFRVLLKKPLKDKQSKKAVRLSIIPTDVEDSEGFEVKKKVFNRNSILELLGEYEAREEMLKE